VDMQRMTVCLLFDGSRSRASMHVYVATEEPYWPDCMSSLIATIAPTAPMHCFFSDWASGVTKGCSGPLITLPSAPAGISVVPATVIIGNYVVWDRQFSWCGPSIKPCH